MSDHIIQPAAVRAQLLWALGVLVGAVAGALLGGMGVGFLASQAGWG